MDVDEEAPTIIEAGKNEQGTERRRDLCNALTLALAKAGRGAVD